MMRNLSAAMLAVCLSVACGGSEGASAKLRTPIALQTQDALRERWNAAADAVEAPMYFLWSSFDRFPHPTYEGGSAQAYEQFAAVLLRFLQDNADFLASEDLFDTELRCLLANGDVALSTSFRQLASEIATTKSGDIPEQTRQELAMFAAQMTTPDAGKMPNPDDRGAPDQAALMKRWNDAVDAVHTPIDFHWPSFDEFPHPTYKHGTADAYEQFAQVLLRFLQDNADFLVSEHLFQTELRYVFPSGDVGLRTSFQKLAEELSSTTSGSIPQQTREELAAFAHGS